MKNKRLFTRMLATVFMVLTLLSGTAMGSSAATWGGSGSSTVNVTTKANYGYPGASSITLKQSKQTVTFKKLWGSKEKKKSGYFGRYTITVCNVTKGTSKNVYWSGGQTKKISLDPNCTYRITVCYDSVPTRFFMNAPLGYSVDRITAPSWSVKSKWKVSSCY